MFDSPEKASFTSEVERQLDGVIEWAITHSPARDVSLSSDDFADLRKEFVIRAKEGNPQEREPEPSEGGAQYINDNPAPWP